MGLHEQLVQDLRGFGITEGDTLVVRIALKSVATKEQLLELSSEKRLTFFWDALKEVIGESGTAMVLTFTKQFFWPFISKSFVFDRNTPTNTGAFANFILQHPDALRSQHPTNSFAAIGPQKEFLLSGHDETSSSYAPIGRLAECRGKYINIGVDPHSPGFTTVHWGQYVLGLATQFRLRPGVYFKNKAGETKLFIRKDTGGCSSAYAKFYPLYRNAGISKEGKVGNASAMLINNAQTALDIELEQMRKNPTFPFCDADRCMTCRIGFRYAPFQIGRYLRGRVT